MVQQRAWTALLLGALLLGFLPLPRSSERTRGASSFADLPCNELPKSTVVAQHLEQRHRDWYRRNRSLALRDPLLWQDGHRAFVEELRAQRREHFQRVVECSVLLRAPREEQLLSRLVRRRGRMQGREEMERIVRREGGFLLYRSSLEEREIGRSAALETLRTERQRRRSYFEELQQFLSIRPTRRSIRAEYRRRTASALIPWGNP